MYNTTLRALELAALPTALAIRVAVYVLNVTYPLIDREFIASRRQARRSDRRGRSARVHELAVNTISRRTTLRPASKAKHAAMAGEYTGACAHGVKAFVRAYRRTPYTSPSKRARCASPPHEGRRRRGPSAPAVVCTGCPERPIFTALKLVAGARAHHVSCDIGCHLF